MEGLASESHRVALGTDFRYHLRMKRSYLKTLEAVFAHPTSANIAWKDIEALLGGLGAEISEREGSRVAIVLFSEVRVFHRPSPVAEDGQRRSSFGGKVA